MKITVIGAGAYGSALGKVLKENGHVVRFYDPFKFPDELLEDCIITTEAVVLAAPSKEVPNLLPELPRDLPLISATKGILDPATFARFENFSVLSGATFADDLVIHKSSRLTTNSEMVKTIFQNHWLTIEITNDLKGIMLCGALKNVYAIYSGAKNLHENTPDFTDFLKAVDQELTEILTQNGCNPKTIDLSCGLPDVELTCAGDRSRNYRFGQKLTSQSKITIQEILETTEGLSTILNLKKYPNFTLPPSAAIIQTVIKLVNQKLIGV